MIETMNKHSSKIFIIITLTKCWGLFHLSQISDYINYIKPNSAI